MPSGVDGYQAIYEGVISGKIRARLEERLIIKQEAADLAKSKWSSDPEQRYMLPADLRMSIEEGVQQRRKVCEVKKAPAGYTPAGAQRDVSMFEAQCFPEHPENSGHS